MPGVWIDAAGALCTQISVVRIVSEEVPSNCTSGIMAVWHETQPKAAVRTTLVLAVQEKPRYGSVISQR